jgi:hypothetical protein
MLHELTGRGANSFKPRRRLSCEPGYRRSGPTSCWADARRPLGPRQRRLDISPGSGLHPFLRWPILKGEVAEQGRELLHLVDYLSNGVGRKYGMRLTLLRSSGATKYERNNYLSSIRNFELMCPCERYTHQDYNGRKNELNYWGVVPLKG